MARSKGYAPKRLERHEVRRWRECVMRKTSCLRSPHHPLPLTHCPSPDQKAARPSAWNGVRSDASKGASCMRAVKGLSSTDEVLQGLELNAGDRRSLLGLAALWLMEQRTRGIARDDLRNN